MRTTIENYRGVEIFFDTDNERFSFNFDDGRWNEKQSYSAAKKKIDDYIKETHDFKPFFVIHNSRNYLQLLEVVSIRKDGDYMVKDKEGRITKLSQYDEKDYVEYSPSDDYIFAQIAVKEIQLDEIAKQIVELKYPLKSRPSLLSMKKKFMPPQ